MNAAVLISRLGAQHGMTQSEIARRVDAHPDHVRAWSNGEECPPDKHELLRKMADAKPDAKSDAENGA